MTKPVILVAEDDNMIRKIYERFLSQYYLVRSCADGQEAIETFSSHEDINLVITDLHMPRKSGKDLIYHIRQSNQSKTPIILASSVNPADIFNGGPSYDLFLSKPFSIGTLKPSIDYFLFQNE